MEVGIIRIWIDLVSGGACPLAKKSRNIDNDLKTNLQNRELIYIIVDHRLA